MRYAQLRILCMFDLPVMTKKQQQQYRVFRKTLIENGFTMLQYSVYYRIVQNRSAAQKFAPILKKMIPEDGDIRLLYVSEKQFNDMLLLVGRKSKQEQAIGNEKMVII
ncbi:CRISPR-associated endonuclease Cas2 [Ligilactobacillus saerimneri]|uniref:CRISPR-associated endonuclease Cas2 n=1 Tax=Ligilactobacillus saerimneri TaxID=228229 RepID=UPI000AADBAFD|nr:CRISPR-associated endonuclease Cas2 [Ligilactobacillus saerimneri]